MNRRKAIGIVVGAGIAAKAHSSRRPALPLSRLKQSVCRWCYQDVPLDVLCREARKIGLVSVELLGEKEWDVPRRFGLTCAMANGPSTIPVGFNRPDQHDRLVAESERLLPLVAFIAVGFFFVDPSRLTVGSPPPVTDLAATALLLIFAFGGYEVIPVPAGEAKDPRHAVPFALIMTILTVAVVMTAVQIVALGTLPGLASSKTPLADASLVFMGAGGAALMTIGAVFSTSGNNMGQALSGSRSMFALASRVL